MSKDVLAFVECKDGAPRKASLELLSAGKQVAAKLSKKIVAVVIGSGIRDVADTIGGYCDAVITVNHELLADYSWDSAGSVLGSIIGKYQPAILLGTSSMTGKDLLPRIAARFQAAMISDAVGFDLDGGMLKIKKPLYGGKVISWLMPKLDSLVIVTFRPNSFAVGQPGEKGEIIEENFVPEQHPAIKTLSLEKAVSKKVDLQEADFIICGGRGMKNAESFGMLDEIGDIMGGRVGASRTVIDAKWREYDDQIGKSGKTVSPKLYIGCGVSGALHHIMGMDTSGVIVAINKDPNAPIFQYADYGIIDDVFAILPALKEELRSAREDV
ncbi:MAG: electron transfer flavoprotein subunit alpha/FixB family protein [Syntrophorhabdaceae bacterium]